MKKFAIIFLGIITIGFKLHGQSLINGFVEYDNITYFKNKDKSKINARNQIILQPEIRHEVNPKANIFGSLEIRYDQANPDRHRIWLDEAYINYYLKNLDLLIGKQIFSWGRADGFNPTDNLSAWDFTDVLDIKNEKLGQVAVAGKYYVSNWNLEGVLAPAFTPSLLPQTGSKWWFAFPSKTVNPFYPDMGNKFLSTTYNFFPALGPDEGLESWQYAFKTSGYVNGWDLSLSWFDGYDDLPSYHSRVKVDSSFTMATISIRPEYHKRWALGGDFAKSIGKFSFRGEAAYYFTEDWEGKDPSIDDPYLQYTLGVDYTNTNLFPDKTLMVLLEWIQEIQFPDRNTQYELFDLNHLFRKSILGRAELQLNDFSFIQFSGLYNIYSKGWYFQPQFEWSLTDGLVLTALIDFLEGPRDSFFGSFQNNDRIQLRMKYSF